MLVLDFKKESFYKLGVQFVRTFHCYDILSAENRPKNYITWTVAAGTQNMKTFTEGSTQFKELEEEYQKYLNPVKEKEHKPCEVCGNPTEKSFQTWAHICVDCSH